MNERRKVDLNEQNLRIAVTQARARGEEAVRIAKENLENYLNSRLTLQIQSSKMHMAATESDKQIIIGINDD